MSQSHLIAESFKGIVAGDGELNAAIPGNVHYGDRLRPEPGFPRPYALLMVKQGESKYHSGGQPAVPYQVQITVFGGQAVGDVGEIQSLLSDKFHPFVVLPSITGRHVGLIPTEGFLTEDENEDQDLDVIVCTLAWSLTIYELESER